MKDIKTESVAEFLARGGKVTKCVTKVHKRLTPKERGYEKEVTVTMEPDLSALPMSLKIKYGIR